MPFIAKYMVYLSDTDAAGIVHFANYLRFVERAEEDFYRSMGGLPKIYEFMPRIEAFIRYESPIRRGDSISVELSLEEARTRPLGMGSIYLTIARGLGLRMAMWRLHALR